MKKTFKLVLAIFLLLLTFPTSIFAEEGVTSLLSPPDTVVRNYTAEEALPVTAIVFENNKQIGSYQVDESILQSKAAFETDITKSRDEFLSSPETLIRNEISTNEGNSSSYYERETSDLPDLIVTPFATTPPTFPVSPNATNIIYVRMGIVVNDTQTPYLITKIVGIQGIPPISLESSVYLYRNTARYGAYSLVTSMSTIWSAGQIWVGNSNVKPFTVTSTAYYESYNAGFGIWSTDGVLSTAGNNWWEYDILLNKIGREYPAWQYIDVHGYLNATMPESTTWAPVSSSVNQVLRDTFNASVKSKYRTFYDQNYGYVDWSQPIEIHHIRPLQFGGTNDFTNLIPLWTDSHAKFTNWFYYY